MSPDALCAGRLAPNAANYATDACAGDSGGPLLLLAGDGTQVGAQIGIVSRGVGCGHQPFPGIYTSTAAHAGWIIAALPNASTPFIAGAVGAPASSPPDPVLVLLPLLIAFLNAAAAVCLAPRRRH